MKILLDTPTLIWTTSSQNRLSRLVQERISSPETSEILVSSISIWEVFKLVSKRKIALSEPLRQWSNKVLRHPAITMIDVTSEILMESCSLPGEFHSDPADQILVATARIHGATILTKDQKILNYLHVKSDW